MAAMQTPSAEEGCKMQLKVSKKPVSRSLFFVQIRLLMAQNISLA